MATKARKTARKKTSTSRSSASLRNDSIPRALLARELQKRINQLGLSRNDAAIAVGDAASQMSRLMTGHITDFSADRLVKMLLRLGSDVTVTIRHPAGAARKRGKVRVHAG
jgi:predicted XRE-type DNA-binding protein